MNANECKAKNCLFFHRASGKPNCYYNHPKVPLRHLKECPTENQPQHTQPIVVNKGGEKVTYHTMNGKLFIKEQ